MGVLTRRHHLRWHERNSERHRGIAPARIAEKRVPKPQRIEPERPMLSRTLQALAEQLDGAALSAALNDFGFADLLAAAPRQAVSALFTGLGRAGSVCTALQAVLRQPLLGVLPDDMAGVDVVLPRIGSDVAGFCDDATATVRGLVI